MKITKELLVRYQNCETSAIEESEILKWLEASPDHRKQMDELDFLFNVSVLTAPLSNCSSERKSVIRKKVWRKVAAYACACAAMAAAFFIGWKVTPVFQDDPESLAVNKIDVPFGQKVDLTLQDGTTVCLNSGSHLEFPAVFRDGKRTVRLSGEAMFDVAKDPEHPFIVETFACDVQAIGTKFDVTADEARNIFSSSLLEGKILVSNRGNDEKVILSPGEMVDLSSGVLALSTIPSNDEFLWTMGVISLEALSFADLMDRFESIYGYRVIYQSDSVPNIRCRGKIRISDGVDHAMDVLKLAGTNFNYEIDHNLNEIYIH